MAQIERNSPTSFARRRKSSASTNSKRLPIGVITAGDEDTYRYPAGEKLKYHYTNEENGQKLRRYWTNACRDCGLKRRCTTGVQRRIARWEHEDVLEAVQKCLDKNPRAMRQRRETAEHPFGTLKMRMGTHFLMKRLP